jgi:hypothetical protein
MRVTAAILLAVAALFAAPVLAAENPVVAAAKRTAAAEAGRFTLNSVTSVPGTGRIVLKGKGTQRGTAISMDVDLVSGGVNTEMSVIGLEEASGYVLYFKSPLFGAQLPAGKTWVKLDLQKAATTMGLDFSSLLDSAQTVDPLRYGIVKTTKVGRGKVAGRDTTRYRVVVDVNRAGKRIPAYQRQLDAIERATGLQLSRVTQHVWIDRAGRFARLTTSYPTVVGSTRATNTVTLTYVSYSAPKPITAPPATTVVDAHG